ncbi:MAG: sulfite oxidase heme-binding subunit YedZ [Thiotrichales bacterium]
MNVLNKMALGAVLKPLTFGLCLIPLAYYLGGLIADSLGANPIEAVTRGLGDWALRLLCLTLAITPLRRLSGWHDLQRIRRMLGLFAFFYAVLHLLTYLWLDQFFDWEEIWRDVVKRPFITVGFATWVLLIPLAITSTDAMVRRLKRRWVQLHRLIYLATPLAVLHFFWMKSSKADVAEPLFYAGVVAALLFYRAIGWRRKPRTSPPRVLQTRL